MKISRKNQIAVCLMLLVCLSGGIFAAGQKPPFRQPLTTELVPHALIQEAGWTYNWQLNLPVKPHEQIDRLYVFADYLYALTDTNVLFCVNRKKGQTLYSVRLCSDRLPMCDPLYYEGRLGFISGNQMIIFNPSTGLVQQREVFEQVGDAFKCAVARNREFVYMAGSDRRLHVLSTEGFWQAFTATADNDSAINSVVATDSIVVFSTQAGNVVGMQPNVAKKIWQYDTTGEIQAGIVPDGDSLYVVSMDAKLYKLTMETGMPAWSLPFYAGAPVLDPVVVGKEVVYLYNDLNGLYAVNKNDGKSVWNIPSGKNIICESGKKAFAFARPGVLQVMDNASGKEVYSVNINQVQRYAKNMADSTLYLAHTDGRLMSVTVE